MQIDNKIKELANMASCESVPTPDVSASVMNTLMSGSIAGGNGTLLRMWFMAASIAASFVMMFLAYKMQSSNTFTDMVDMVAWAV